MDDEPHEICEMCHENPVNYLAPLCPRCGNRPCDHCWNHFLQCQSLHCDTVQCAECEMGMCVICESRMCDACGGQEQELCPGHQQDALDGLLYEELDEEVELLPDLSPEELAHHQHEAKTERPNPWPPVTTTGVPKEFCCSLTGERMNEPRLAICGCSFEQDALQHWNSVCCPMCLTPFRRKGEAIVTVQNRALQEDIIAKA